MSEKILSPTIEVPEIKVEIDKEPAQGTYEGFKTSLGQYVPLLALGDTEEQTYVNWSKISSFNLSVQLYKLPQVDFVIDDDDFKIRRHLKNDLDVGICRIGYNNFASQFKILFTDIYNLSGSEIHLSGILYDEKMWEDVEQKRYKQSPLSEVIKNSCSDNGLGLLVYNNEELQTEIDVIQTSQSKYDFLDYILHNFSTNVWCYDLNYFLHLGSYEKIAEEEVSKYTLDYKTGEKLKEPKDLIFVRNYLFGKGGTEADVNDDFKIPVKYYFPESEYSDRFINFKKQYKQYTEKEDVTIPQSDFGIGETVSNTFSGFGLHKIAYSDRIREKNISKQVIHVFTDYIIPELNPLSNINLELFNNTMFSDKSDDKTGDMDVEHSGKKTVLGFNIIYKKKAQLDESTQQFTEEILCI